MNLLSIKWQSTSNINHRLIIMWLSGVCGPHVPVCIPKEIWAYSSGECALGAPLWREQDLPVLVFSFTNASGALWSWAMTSDPTKGFWDLVPCSWSLFPTVRLEECTRTGRWRPLWKFLAVLLLFFCIPLFNYYYTLLQPWPGLLM